MKFLNKLITQSMIVFSTNSGNRFTNLSKIDKKIIKEFTNTYILYGRYIDILKQYLIHQ